MDHDQVGLTAGLQGFNTWKLINVTHYRSIKDKIHMVISIDAEKNTWQNPTAFMTEILNKPGGKREFPQTDKGHQWKSLK